MAAQVAEDLKTVTYATPPMEERREKKNLPLGEAPIIILIVQNIMLLLCSIGVSAR